MKKVSRVLIVLSAFMLLAASCGSSTSSDAAESGSIQVEEARYRLARSDLGAGYMTVSNTTDSAVTLFSASAEGVGTVELHESVQDDAGTFTMESRPEGFVIEAGETVNLEPGGKHLMLFDPEGTEDLTFTLDFGDETLEVLATYDAEASAAAQSGDDDEHGDHGGDDDEHGDHGGDEEHSDDAMESMEDDEAMEDTESMEDTE